MENKKIKIIDFTMNFNLQLNGEFVNVKIIENSGFTKIDFFPSENVSKEELIKELQKVFKKESLFQKLYTNKYNMKSRAIIK